MNQMEFDFTPTIEGLLFRKSTGLELLTIHRTVERLMDEFWNIFYKLHTFTYPHYCVSLSECLAFSTNWPSWTVRAGQDVLRPIGIATVCSCWRRRRRYCRSSPSSVSSITPRRCWSSWRRRDTGWRRRCRRPRAHRARGPTKGQHPNANWVRRCILKWHCKALIRMFRFAGLHVG